MKYAFCVIMMVFAGVTSAAESWKLYFGNDKVQVFYRYEDCHDTHNGIHQQKILLKFVNLANAGIELSFTRDMVYSNAKPGGSDKKSYTLKLAANATIEADCATKDEALFIFSKHLDFEGSVLKKFELKDFVVKR